MRDFASRPPSVLLVDDDVPARTALRDGLSGEGFAVGEAGSGVAGLHALTAGRFDAVCLHLTLADRDGLAVCRDIRAGSAIPIVLVAERVGAGGAVAGLDAGADDVVQRPVAVPELAARLRALLRRAPECPPRTVCVGGLEIIPQDELVLRGGKLVALTRTERRLLCRLAATPGETLSRQDLLRQVWGVRPCRRRPPRRRPRRPAAAQGRAGPPATPGGADRAQPRVPAGP